MEGNLHYKIDQAYLQLEGNLHVIVLFLPCFVLYLRAFSKYKSPGLISRGAIKWRVFCVTSLKGLYLEGLIFRVLPYLTEILTNKHHPFFGRQCKENIKPNCNTSTSYSNHKIRPFEKLCQQWYHQHCAKTTDE